jgi:hypothetical protein
MLVMAWVFTAITFVQAQMKGREIAFVAFAVATVALWALVVRSLRMAVVVGPRGITSRGFTRTIKISWAEVSEIELGGGVGTAGGATAPVVVRIRPGKPPQRIELGMIGTYGVSRRGVARAEQANVELRRRLADWRNEHLADPLRQTAEGETGGSK